MSTSSANPSVAVIGCGQWGKNLVRNFADLGVLRWVCDTHEASLQAQARLHPGLRLARRLDDVLSDDDVRAVVIASPPALHYPQAKKAILSGKDVFVEKPLALRYDDGQDLVDLAEVHNAILMVGHILEYHPAVTMLKDVMQRGELGRAWYIYSHRLNLGRVRQEENILWSFAPHDISVICNLLGSQPAVVNSFGGCYLQSGIVDVTVTNLSFEGGVKAHIFVSWLHPYKEQKLVVVGERKMAVFDDLARESKLKVYDKGIEWRAGLPIPRQTAETVLFFEDTEPLQLECEHFLTCITERQQPLTDGKSALKVLKVLEASQRSLEQGGLPVPLSAIEAGVRV